jgi:hypothetical protein
MELLGGHSWVIVLLDTEDEEAKVMFVEPQLGEYISNDMVSSDGFMYRLQAVIM